MNWFQKNIVFLQNQAEGITHYFKTFAVLGKLLQKRNALFITCYCHFKVISYITVLLSLNCKALDYFDITFVLLSPK